MASITDSEDLFGNKVNKGEVLRDKFLEPPFSVLDTKSGSWQKRKKMWSALGMKSEVGRDATTFNIKSWCDDKLEDNKVPSDTSIFDPALCEVVYNWFVPEKGTILDPFAGGSVRGIVANYLGFKYAGIDIRQEQIDSNREQAEDILGQENQPIWICGDSNIVLSKMKVKKKFDFVFSCPPYADLEVYSELPGDISNMPYPKFLELYRSIISKSCEHLKDGGYACFVVGEVRDKNGDYIGFVPDTIRAFQDCGMKFYNEAILLQSIATASIRADKNMTHKKLVKVHQNVLIFRKPKFSL